MKRPTSATACAFAAAAIASPAAANAQNGKFQVKAFATAVLPDGKIDSVRVNAIGAPDGSQTRASNAVVPTIAIEYFLNPRLSIETICCVTPHNVDGAGPLASARLVDDALILPATITLKYHFDLGAAKPYIGAGPTRFFIFGEDVGSGAAARGATRVKLSDEFGMAIQAGVDFPLNKRGLGLSFDAKRYFVDTTASFYAGNTLALQTRHTLDPYVLSAGLSHRF